METAERTFNLDELSHLSEQPRRTIRYYIQIGLLDKPTGLGRGAHYTGDHLSQLLQIRKWQQAGLSLERIQELLRAPAAADLVPPAPPRKPGTLEVWSHLVIAEGVELTIDPGRAGLTPEQVKALAGAVMDQFQRITLGEPGETS
jgi:DNA-binding transcriptional MerR regulator